MLVVVIVGIPFATPLLIGVARGWSEPAPHSMAFYAVRKILERGPFPMIVRAWGMGNSNNLFACENRQALPPESTSSEIVWQRRA